MHVRCGLQMKAIVIDRVYGNTPRIDNLACHLGATNGLKAYSGKYSRVAAQG